MAEYIKTFGVVIKQNNVGEADKTLTVLTKDIGKIHIWVNGARRPRSRYLAFSQLFCASNFILYKSRDSYRINSGEVVETFFDLRNDLDKLSRAAYIVELTNDGIPENMPEGCGEYMRLLLNTLHFISKTQRNQELLVHIFEIKFMSMMGFRPVLSDFGAEIASGKISLSKSAVMAVSHIINSDMEHVFRFDVSKEVLEELNAFCIKYISECMGKEYKRLHYYS